MTSIAFRNRLADTLLGRIRLNLFEQISGSGNVPSGSAQRRFVINQYRTNPCIGSLYRALLWMQSTHQIDSDELNVTYKPHELLAVLETDPLPLDVFAEVKGSCLGSDPVGLLFTRSHLVPSGFVYEVSILHENWLEAGLGRLEIRACQESPEPVVSLLTPTGFVRLGFNDVDTEPVVSLVFTVLCVLKKRLGIHTIDAKSISAKASFIPPDDPALAKLLSKLLMGKVNCSIAEVAFNMVAPLHPEFCLKLPLELIDAFGRFVESRQADYRRILVYWNGQKLIMSDDYFLYLAYRKLGYSQVPVTIIGGYPDFVKPSMVGGRELLPPVGMVNVSRSQALSEDEIEESIDARLRVGRSKHIETIAHLCATFIRLAEIINNPNADEAAIHCFLREHPIAIDPIGVRIESEVWLGAKYRVDLAIETRGVLKQLELIELEPANLSIFTNSGRPRAKITHAIQQVEDWLRWWHECPSEVPKLFDPTIVPLGLVVAGRSNNMSDDDRRRLSHLNANRVVKLITYDELLSQIESLIDRLEQTE